MFKGGGFCQNLCIATHFHTFGPNLRTIDQRVGGGGGGGGRSIHFWKSLFNWSRKIPNAEPQRATRKKLLQQKSKT